MGSERITRKSRGGFTAETFQPEEAFTKNPHSEYVCEDLSSFERLLLHALCAYNSLNSHSFDFAGKRLIRVENPHPSFFRRDPGLCSYLLERMKESKAAKMGEILFYELLHLKRFG